jgi:L-threonylcarbamoyladenylate synthase
MQKDIKQAVETLRKGGTLIYPTDTIWALGCDATNAQAVDTVFKIKNRKESKSPIVLVSDIGMLQNYIQELPEVAWDLIEYADKPLTLIFDEARNLAPNVIANDGSIAIRVVKDEFARQLIERFHKPIVSTSANISGEPHPNFFDEISEEVKTAVDYIVSWGQEDRTPRDSSSIMKIKNNGEFKLIRQ